jgi:hypothetical protein
MKGANIINSIKDPFTRLLNEANACIFLILSIKLEII